MFKQLLDKIANFFSKDYMEVRMLNDICKCVAEDFQYYEDECSQAITVAQNSLAIINEIAENPEKYNTTKEDITEKKACLEKAIARTLDVREKLKEFNQ